MNPLDIVKGALGLYKPDASTWAGGGAAVLTFMAGCVLVAAGVAIPPISILGIHLVSASIPITMTMVAGAMPVVSHLVTSLVPATYKQTIDAFAQKIDAEVQDVKTVIPVIQASYPDGKNGQGEAPPVSDSNINKAVG